MKSFAAVVLLAAAASAATVVSPSSYVYSAQSAYPEVQVKGVNSPVVSTSYLSRAAVAPPVVSPVAPVAPVYAGQVAYQAQPYAYQAQPYAYQAQPYAAYSQYVQPAYPGVATYAQPAVYAPAVHV